MYRPSSHTAQSSHTGIVSSVPVGDYLVGTAPDRATRAFQKLANGEWRPTSLEGEAAAYTVSGEAMALIYGAFTQVKQVGPVEWFALRLDNSFQGDKE